MYHAFWKYTADIDWAFWKYTADTEWAFWKYTADTKWANDPSLKAWQEGVAHRLWYTIGS
jgi:hypothetical protein